MMKLWWVTSLIWLVLFGATATFLAIREVDGAGIEQTPEIRLVNFVVLGVAFVFVLLCQLVFLFFARKTKSVSSH
ncbi:MAG: DUF3923 family protein [Solibacillus sp.]